MAAVAFFGGSEPIPRAVMEVFKAVNALASQSLKNDGTKEGIVESYNNAISWLSEDGGPESINGMGSIYTSEYGMGSIYEDEYADEDEDDYVDEDNYVDDDEDDYVDYDDY